MGVARISVVGDEFSFMRVQFLIKSVQFPSMGSHISPEGDPSFFLRGRKFVHGEPNFVFWKANFRSFGRISHGAVNVCLSGVEIFAVLGQIGPWVVKERGTFLLQSVWG